MGLFFLQIIIFISITAASRPPVCTLSSCSCNIINSNNDENNNTLSDVTSLGGVYDVACFVKSVSLWESAVEKLTPDVASLKFICIDAHAQSRLTDMTFGGVPRLELLAIDGCEFSAVSPSPFR
jgi:hypothetical protein